MALLIEVLQIVAPVFSLAFIGFAWVRLGLRYDVEFVTRLAMSLAVPCLIFAALLKSDIAPAVLRDTALATLLAYALVGAAVFLCLKAAGLSQPVFWAPLTFGNTGNLGLPLALFAFGAAGLDLAVVVFAVMAVLSFTLGVWVVSGRSSPLTALREPMVWATVLGGVFLATGWQLPEWSVNTIELIGQMGIPLMLMTLGVAISRLSPRGLGRAAVLSVLKLAICLAAALLAGRLLALPPVAVGVLTLQVMTPVAVTSYMLAEKYGNDAAEVAGLVVVSTLIAILAIPLVLAAFI